MTSPRVSALPVAASAAAFLDTLRGKSPRTSSTYRTCLAVFQDFLSESELEDALTTALPPDVLERFYLWLVGEFGRSKQFTINTYVAGVRSFFRYLERIGQGPDGTTLERIRAGLREITARSHYLAPRPNDDLPRIVMLVNETLEQPSGDNQARLIVLRDRAVINVLYTTGLRREEVSRLNRQDVGEGRKSSAIITGKGDKQRVVFFDEETLRYIRAYLEARNDRHAPLFIQHGPARGKPRRGTSDYRLSPQSVYKTVKHWASLAGVEDVSTHDFRHTKATTLLNQGAPLDMVQDLLGHASPATTKIIYAHYEQGRLREAFDRYSLPARDLVARREQEHLARNKAGARQPDDGGGSTDQDDRSPDPGGDGLS
jgi:site-specific recombinase XerD